MFKNTVLAIDDDLPFCDYLRRSLEKEGFQVLVVNTTEEAQLAMKSRPIDVMLLDVKVPSVGGIQFCQWLRAQSEKKNIPIVMVSVLGSEDDKVRGLEAGADDYIPKPFHSSVLVARIRAVLRRSGVLTSILTAGEITINLDTRKVQVQKSEPNFSPKEFDLLTILVRHKDKLLTRQFLCDAVWGSSNMEYLDRVDKYVKLLRDKLGPCAHYLETVWGLGYRFVPKAPQSPHFYH